MISALLLLFVAQANVPHEVVQLARVKHDMSAALEKIPDYTCLETVERSISAPNAKSTLKVHDTVHMDVAFIGGREVYGKHGAGRIDKAQPGHFITFGLTSNGEFVGHARTVFGASGSAQIHYGGPETRDGRAALRWDYVVPYLVSGWALQYAGRETRVAAVGSFWVDGSSLEVTQLDIDAMGIEPGFPIAAVHESIQYERVQLGPRLALIPTSADVLMTEKDGALNRNAVRFTQCKEYRAESEISFDSDPPVKK
jgi:hypothetical protein